MSDDSPGPRRPGPADQPGWDERTIQWRASVLGPTGRPPRASKLSAALVIGIGVLTAALFLGLVATIVDGTQVSSPGASPFPNGAAQSGTGAPLGQPVRDGNFEFTVQQVQCGQPEVGASPVAQRAKGTFCVVSVDIRNAGTESRTFDTTNQKAYAGAGTEYSASGAAGQIANTGNTGFLTQISPGAQVRGVIVFDVPPGTDLTRLELHDSAFSRGAQASLK